jgi:hypothetical protein
MSDPQTSGGVCRLVRTLDHQTDSWWCPSSVSIPGDLPPQATSTANPSAESNRSSLHWVTGERLHEVDLSHGRESSDKMRAPSLGDNVLQSAECEPPFSRNKAPPSSGFSPGISQQAYICMVLDHKSLHKNRCENLTLCITKTTARNASKLRLS